MTVVSSDTILALISGTGTVCDIRDPKFARADINSQTHSLHLAEPPPYSKSANITNKTKSHTKKGNPPSTHTYTSYLA